MELKTVADWESSGGDEMRWRLTVADAPATFAVCRHYPSWMRMFHLFSLCHEATGDLEFLDAVDELRVWEPHAAMTRRIYDVHVSGEKEDGHKKVNVPRPIREALADAFAAADAPDRADIFEVAYREVVFLVNEGRYRDFKEMAQGVRAALNSEHDEAADANGDVGPDRERMARRCRKPPASVIREESYSKV